jgi:hypothetical protein
MGKYNAGYGSRRRVKKQLRNVMISFRLRQDEIDLLIRDMRENPACGIKSVKQFARKITVDYVRKRLHYINPLDKMADADIRSIIQNEIGRAHKRQHNGKISPRKKRPQAYRGR